MERLESNLRVYTFSYDILDDVCEIHPIHDLFLFQVQSLPLWITSKVQVLNPLTFSTILETYMLIVRNLPLQTIRTNDLINQKSESLFLRPGQHK